MTALIRPDLRRATVLRKGVRNARYMTVDSRDRLSNFWAPVDVKPRDVATTDSKYFLIGAGFLRKAYSGVYHVLPLGLRVQNKLEALIDKHMSTIGASKLSLSAITTEALWKKSGRFSQNAELLRLNDRRKSGLLLSPTHEEEITAIVKGAVVSYKDLPIRLYQIGRKYRDERRPRGGLLRAKEFLMKDLYTFDVNPEDALQTYEAVRIAYNNLFNELKIPYLVADADSGNMGGNLSHEYHFVSSKGEDNVWSCDSCSYTANEELVEKGSPEEKDRRTKAGSLVFTGISSDRTTAIKIHIPRPSNYTSSQIPSWDQISEFVNLHAVKNAGVDIDTGIEASTLAEFLPNTTQTIAVQDSRIATSNSTNSHSFRHHLDLSVVRQGDPCPRCSSGVLSVQKAIEVGHTFHLGTRYSVPLNAVVAVPGIKEPVPVEMGCHGIGVSRIIGAIAELLKDEKGLNWPSAIAPWDCVVIARPGLEDDATNVYDVLKGARVDVLLDDRAKSSREFVWKMNDADAIGYPIIVVLGEPWRESRQVEVQCRRLGVKKYVHFEELRDEVTALLGQL